MENLKKSTSYVHIRSFANNGTVWPEDEAKQTWISSSALALGGIVGSYIASMIIIIYNKIEYFDVLIF